MTEKYQEYMDSEEKQQKLYKKTLIIVILSQIFGGAGLAAGITVGALLAKDILGTDSVSGLPTTLFTFGSAGAALLIGKISNQFGRRSGLASGFLVGGLGAIGVVLAAMIENIVLLFLALFIYGAGSATNLLARYAGTDLANAKQRAKAISLALVSTTFGAVAGPNLVDVMGEVATGMGIPALAGPFILAACAYIVAGVVLFIFLRPDPFIVAKAIAENEKKLVDIHNNEGLTNSDFSNRRGIIAGAIVMITTQFVMVAIMTMTPIFMGNHHHALHAVGFVIGLHIIGMYLPSLVTGVLVDRVGRAKMAYTSVVTLLIAGGLAAFGSIDSIGSITIALLLLGIGWNFGLISGTAILVDSTSTTTRAKTQGMVDVWIAFSGAIGGGISGVIVAYTNFAILSIATSLLAILIVPAIIWAGINKQEQI